MFLSISALSVIMPLQTLDVVTVKKENQRCASFDTFVVLSTQTVSLTKLQRRELINSAIRHLNDSTKTYKVEKRKYYDTIHVNFQLFDCCESHVSNLSTNQLTLMYTTSFWCRNYAQLNIISK